MKFDWGEIRMFFVQCGFSVFMSDSLFELIPDYFKSFIVYWWPHADITYNYFYLAHRSDDIINNLADSTSQINVYHDVIPIFRN